MHFFFFEKRKRVNAFEKKKKAKRSIYAFTSFARRKRMHFFHPFFSSKKKLSAPLCGSHFFPPIYAQSAFKEKEADGCALLRSRLKRRRKKSMNVLPFFLRAAKRSFFSIFFREKKKARKCGSALPFFRRKKMRQFFFLCKKRMHWKVHVWFSNEKLRGILAFSFLDFNAWFAMWKAPKHAVGFCSCKTETKKLLPPFFSTLFFVRKKGWKKKKKSSKMNSLFHGTFKRMCTKKCEQENMAKGREKNFFLLSRKAVHLCIYAQSAFVEKKEALRSIFFSSKKKGQRKKAAHGCAFFPFFFFECAFTRFYAQSASEGVRIFSFGCALRVKARKRL